MLLDIIIIFIFIISIISCFKNGFSVSLFNNISSVLSIAFVSLLYKPVVFCIKESKLGKSLYIDLHNMFYENYVSGANELINIEKLPKFLTSSVDTSIDATAEVIGYITDKTFDIIVFIASFIIVALLVKIIVKVFPKILKLTSKLPILKQLDKLLGMCFGVLTGSIWTVLIVNVLSVISVLFEFEYFAHLLTGSYIADILSFLKLNLFTI